MNVDKIHWSGTGISQNAEVVAEREDRVEGTERVAVGVISAGDVCLDAEPRAKRQTRQAVSRLRGESPCTYVVGAEGPELHDPFVVEIQPRLFFRNRPLETPPRLCLSSVAVPRSNVAVFLSSPR